MKSGSDLYYKKVFSCPLGNLTKLHRFLSLLAENFTSLGPLEYNIPRHFSLDLKEGNELEITSRLSFYSVKGACLIPLFDDWEGLNRYVEERIGPTLTSVPVISFSNYHVNRHVDIRRAAALNVGLWNTEDSVTCFWDGKRLKDHVRFNVGEAVLLNVKFEHSVTFNDTEFRCTPRAVLMWSSATPYADLLKRPALL